MASTRKRKTLRDRKNERNVRIRMYRHGLGDCFLVRFPRDDGDTCNLLIDCGLISVASEPRVQMEKVVADIAHECNNRVDVAVMTHEHWDHASGYSSQQARAVFEEIEFREAWYAWTEDPKNPLGTKLRREREAKVEALQRAALAMRDSGSALAVRTADRVESILQFFGVADTDELRMLAAAKGGAVGKTRQAFEYLKQRPSVTTRFCHPSSPPIELPGVSGVRVYVLGPPQDEGFIKRSAPTKKGAEVYEFSADIALDTSLGIAFERMRDPSKDVGGADCPFDASFGFRHGKGEGALPPRLKVLIDKVWSEPGLEWRRIDEDWTQVAESLALNLDSHTNNTCLVLAFELVETGRVLLFAADAQVGNWLSWQATKWAVKNPDGSSTTVTGPDLLRRAVFYKVGHHGSHNATLRALGLEQMLSGDLAAFVPVFKDQAEKNRWHEMPFGPLVKRLREKTGGRLVFSDPKIAPPDASLLAALAPQDRTAFLRRLTVSNLFYEYSVPY